MESKLIGFYFSGNRSDISAIDGNTNDAHQFYGPLTSCSDLARLGYTLNGYYLTRNNHGGEGLNKITCCQFRLLLHLKSIDYFILEEKFL